VWPIQHLGHVWDHKSIPELPGHVCDHKSIPELVDGQRKAFLRKTAGLTDEGTAKCGASDALLVGPSATRSDVEESDDSRATRSDVEESDESRATRSDVEENDDSRVTRSDV
jgi:hypothetical protein